MNNYEELESLCDFLSESERICEACSRKLKKMVRYVLINNPDLFNSLPDGDEMTIRIHASCSVRLLCMLHGLWEGGQD